MTEEIDISKLHGVIKQYALACERDNSGAKGYGKLNTTQEIKLFKEMVIRNGKQAELKRQLPNIKGVTVPEVKPKKSDKDVNKRIIDLMKEEHSDENKDALKNAVIEKLNR
ncbi:MAG: hypothetical protein K6E29_03975 [Cyanobacteria bacterium RUI128]|nr:hypothetical protein [Cyanobacteria bacterium RUI128]